MWPIKFSMGGIVRSAGIAIGSIPSFDFSFSSPTVSFHTFFGNHFSGMGRTNFFGGWGRIYPGGSGIFSFGRNPDAVIHRGARAVGDMFSDGRLGSFISDERGYIDSVLNVPPYRSTYDPEAAKAKREAEKAEKAAKEAKDAEEAAKKAADEEAAAETPEPGSPPN